MTTYRGAGMLAVATQRGAIVLWGEQVAIYPSIEEARATVGALEQAQLSKVEADWLSARISAAEQRLKQVMWG